MSEQKVWEYKVEDIFEDIPGDPANVNMTIPEEIREEIQSMREEIHNDIESVKNTEHNFDPTGFIWALCGLAFVVLLLAGVMVYMISSIKKALPSMVKEIAKESL